MRRLLNESDFLMILKAIRLWAHPCQTTGVEVAEVEGIIVAGEGKAAVERRREKQLRI